MTQEIAVPVSAPATRIGRFWASTVGKKIVMGATGLIMVAFVIGHMAGNLLIFAGPTHINGYSAFLHGTGELLWLVRLVLLAAVTLHVISAYQLTRIEMRARPVAYAKREPQVSTVAARTIRWGGVLLLVFIVFHLLHMTTGTLHPDFVPGDVYSNVVVGFRVWPVSAFYVLAMIALGLHLYHGTWSACRTLGLGRPSAHPLERRAVTVLAILVAGGFALVPLAVLLGFVR
jgi:succinate dehydrogenase / fumarate reductase, cytochrome b subunit